MVQTFSGATKLRCFFASKEIGAGASPARDLIESIIVDALLRFSLNDRRLKAAKVALTTGMRRISSVINKRSKVWLMELNRGRTEQSFRWDGRIYYEKILVVMIHFELIHFTRWSIHFQVTISSLKAHLVTSKHKNLYLGDLRETEKGSTRTLLLYVFISRSQPNFKQTWTTEAKLHITSWFTLTSVTRDPSNWIKLWWQRGRPQLFGEHHPSMILSNLWNGYVVHHFRSSWSTPLVHEVMINRVNITPGKFLRWRWPC